MKRIDKALIAAGMALALAGGVAAGALLPVTSLADAAGAVTNAGREADHGPRGPSAFAAAATYIGITEDALRTEMGTTKSLADVAVAHGKTRDGLIAALVQSATADITKLVDQKGLPARPAPGGPGGPAGPRGFGGPGGPAGFVAGDPFAAASTYLGISTADLRTKMAAGQTLAAIATAAGKTRDGLIQALVADAKSKLDQAQKDGKITAEAATRISADLTARITHLVDSTGPGRRGRP